MIVKDALAEALRLAKEEKRYLQHKAFKRQLGANDFEPIPDLSALKIAALACPDNEMMQKVIAYTLNKGINTFDERLCSSMVEKYLPDILNDLSLAMPPILEWWLAGARPENVPSQSIDSILPKSQAEAVRDAGAGIQNDDTKAKESQLHVFIWRVYQFLNANGEKSTAQKVWNEIQHRYKQHDTKNIIQEVTADVIFWCSSYGNEQQLKRSSFDKTLSNLKKNPPF